MFFPGQVREKALEICRTYEDPVKSAAVKAIEKGGKDWSPDAFTALHRRALEEKDERYTNCVTHYTV